MTDWAAMRMLRARGLAPKKSLGQNFLRDARLSRRIAALATTPPGGTVLEIGAGLGALTGDLLDRAQRVVAVELDRDLTPILREVLGAAPGLTIVEGDATRLAWAPLLAGGPRPHVVAGNLPYSITGRLISEIVRAAPAIDRAVVMVQREVANRLLATPGGRIYGASSVFAQAVFAVERVAQAAPGAFAPAPRVSSTVLLLTPHVSPRARETSAFRLVVKQAFGQRRKTLRNAWRGLGGLAAADVERLASAAGISLDDRAERLSVEAFAAMARGIESLLLEEPGIDRRG